jgi:hypothetical protein
LRTRRVWQSGFAFMPFIFRHKNTTFSQTRLYFHEKVVNLRQSLNKVSSLRSSQ